MSTRLLRELADRFKENEGLFNEVDRYISEDNYVQILTSVMRQPLVMHDYILYINKRLEDLESTRDGWVYGEVKDKDLKRTTDEFNITCDKIAGYERLAIEIRKIQDKEELC